MDLTIYSNKELFLNVENIEKLYLLKENIRMLLNEINKEFKYTKDQFIFLIDCLHEQGYNNIKNNIQFRYNNQRKKVYITPSLTSDAIRF